MTNKNEEVEAVKERERVHIKDVLKDEKLSIALPNELFDQLLQMVKEKELKSVHVGFAYSFVYLQTYLYRYAIYGRCIPNKQEIKETLTYTRYDIQTNYIIKENGLLENKDIMMTTKEFPVLSEYENADTSLPTFTTIQESVDEYSYCTLDQLLKQRGGTTRSTCMYPVFAFVRYEDENGVGEEGTFYDITNTTLLDMQTFMFCMNTEGIGVNGFYLYAYLTYQNFKFSNNFNATAKRMSSETGMSERVIQRLLDAMRQHNMIKTVHNMPCVSLAAPKEDRKASSHIVNEYKQFSIDKLDNHKPLPFVSEKWYETNELSKRINIDSSELPF